MIPIIAVSFLVLLLLGVPVAFVIGVAGFIGLWWSGDYPLTVIVKQIFEGVDSFVLLAIPLFILAGSLMETGGIAVRLVRLAQVLVGWIRGGLSMAVVVAEYIFSGISGSTVADVSAIGSTMIPPMLRAGYRPEQAVAVVSAASAMGILVPPCILMIVIGSVANVSVAALFAAGFLPAVVLALAIMVYIWYDAGRSGIEARERASWGDIWRAFSDAVMPLGLPAIIFGGILGGVVTPTEAAVLAVLYAFIVGVFVYREIKWADLPRILIQSAVVTAAVCFLLGTAAVVAWVLAVQQIPQLLLKAMLAVPGGNLVFLGLTALLFIVLGAVLEGLPAVVILLPTFMPVVTRLGIDVIHYSTVVVAATGIGLFLPPIGVGFFIACGIANIPGDRATRAMMPYVYMMCVGLLIVILVPVGHARDPAPPRGCRLTGRRSVDHQDRGAGHPVAREILQGGVRVGQRVAGDPRPDRDGRGLGQQAEAVAPGVRGDALERLLPEEVRLVGHGRHVGHVDAGQRHRAALLEALQRDRHQVAGGREDDGRVHPLGQGLAGSSRPAGPQARAPGRGGPRRGWRRTPRSPSAGRPAA